METVVPFRAWRFDTHKAGELDRLVAPPYDVIDPGLQSRLYARSPHNVVRIDFGMTTPGDNECDSRYTRAASQISEWKQAGILVRDPQPSLTFVEEVFTGPDGRERTRHGFLGLMKLYDFEAGVVYPHENTLSGPKEDRFRLLTATDMSLSPVFLLYDLPGDEITTAWRAGCGMREPEAVILDPEARPESTVTRLWTSSDTDLLELVQRTLADAKFIIADGHHRYETALRYQKYHHDQMDHRDQIGGEAAGGNGARASGTQQLSCDYALAYFANLSDPGLAIYGTHRVVAGLNPEVIAALPRLLAANFAVERLSVGTGGSASGEPADVVAAMAAYLQAHRRGAFGLWGPSLDAPYGFRLTNPEAVRAATPGHGAGYRGLDVTILQALVLEEILGITPGDIASEAHLAYVKDPNEAFNRLRNGEFQAGFFLNPTGLDQIRDMAFTGERMPQKATFFYPKLPTGLVFHELRGQL